MKKILLLIFVFIGLFLTGCGKSNNDVLDSLGKKLDETTSYYAEATMSVSMNNQTRNYELKVYYKDSDLYKVELKNIDSNNTQIIIKNTEGVYVLTPSLNKSFKFNSNWPTAGNHAYLLQSLVKSIVNDDSPKIETTNDKIIITVDINDAHNKELSYQTISIEKETLKPKQVVIYDTQNKPMTTVEFTKFEYNVDIPSTTFEVKKSIDDERETGVTAPKDRKVTYPSYFPLGTALIEEDIYSDRGVMKFDGTYSFTVMQEFMDDSTSVSTESVLGEIIILNNGIGAISDSSIVWIQNGIEFMVFSENLPKSELIRIANSFIMGNDK